jgi:hypothetical protein
MWYFSDCGIHPKREWTTFTEGDIMGTEPRKVIGHRRPGSPAVPDPQTNTNRGRRKIV